MDRSHFRRHPDRGRSGLSGCAAMSVIIRSIADIGNVRKERVVMKVVTATDIGQYAMFRAGYDGRNVTTGVTDVFWFPDKAVGPGDFVVLYSRAGTSTEHSNKDGTK